MHTHPPLATPHNANNLDVITQAPNNALTNLVFLQTHDITGQIFTNQTGCFQITSNCGHAYPVIFYIYNANFITSVPIKNCTKEELLQAYEQTYAYLTARRVQTPTP
jgi:hypothetical protein